MTDQAHSAGSSPHPRPDHFRARNPQAASAGPFARFFRRRGALDLTRDASGHRRYAWLHEDMLT
ncbi:hypothetical protein [Erythrobacter sp.]|uniref:hypothetical protein n=1 Tax=Erythrobacter sp. TaxID=1042 RepID=UPI001425F006|nr:hypothetical protein [Erythrobacter sp.]QIQ85352.1 MAG: hypothetical protein G9473_00635 [Erythrobacter sp.]